jgi:uncharacterized LabA/DUF88 family protein
MPREAVKRAVAFIDASNTRASARRAFGDAFGNFNPVALAEEVCAAQGWTLAGVSYYLGVPDVRVTEDGHYTWMKRCARWRKQGVRVFTRTLLQDEQGTAREKGIDVRLALDAVRLYREGAYDVAVVFSQDQDFSELATELRAIAREEKRTVEVVSAFPAAPPAEGVAAPGGISGTIAVALGEDEFRKVLDTPENRKRINTPLPPQRPHAGEIKAAVLPIGTQAATVPLPAPIKTQRGAGWGWLIGPALVYVIAAAATFGYLGWADRAALTSPDAALPVLAQHAARSLAWPAYWLEREDLKDVKALTSRLPQLQALLN